MYAREWKRVGGNRDYKKNLNKERRETIWKKVKIDIASWECLCHFMKFINP